MGESQMDSDTIAAMDRLVAASGGDTESGWQLRVGEPGYPVRLLALPQPPSEIFVAGSLIAQDAFAVAIVGSRRASAEERQEAFALARDLAVHGVTVVSGLALGIDTAAHAGAIAASGGRTIAVVATGLDQTFPAENRDLDLLIRTRGAVISQLPPQSRAAREHFLARNGVVAALSLVVVVIASDEHSGTRNTINHAHALGRPVAFWAPTMQNERWAQRMTAHTRSYFVANAGEVLQLMGDDPGRRSDP